MSMGSPLNQIALGARFCPSNVAKMDNFHLYAKLGSYSYGTNALISIKDDVVGFVPKRPNSRTRDLLEAL